MQCLCRIPLANHAAKLYAFAWSCHPLQYLHLLERIRVAQACSLPRHCSLALACCSCDLAGLQAENQTRISRRCSCRLQTVLLVANILSQGSADHRLHCDMKSDDCRKPRWMLQTHMSQSRTLSEASGRRSISDTRRMTQPGALLSHSAHRVSC